MANLLSWAGLDDPSDTTLRTTCALPTTSFVSAATSGAAQQQRPLIIVPTGQGDYLSPLARRTGDDVIVVRLIFGNDLARLRDQFPLPGFWKERFNSDAYDHWVNPQVAGNDGGIVAQGRGAAVCSVRADRDPGQRGGCVQRG